MDAGEKQTGGHVPAPGPEAGPARGPLPDLLKQSVVAHIAVIALLGVVVYANSLDAPFVFDDKAYVLENPVIKDAAFFLDPSRAETSGLYNIYHIFRARYVAYLSLFINYASNGLDPRGYHAFNLAVHIANGLMLYFIARLLFRTPFLKGSRLAGSAPLIALFSSLVFVSHPVQTQAVTYISQRFASLSAFFYLASFSAYALWRTRGEGQGRPWSPWGAGIYASSLLLSVLAMKTKETAFTLPAAMLIFEFSFMEGRAAKRLLGLGPLMLSMLIVPLGVMDMDMPLGQAIAEATRTQVDITRHDYMLTQSRVLVTYMRLLLLPLNLNLDYDYPVLGSGLDPRVAVSGLATLSVIFLLAYLHRRARAGGGPGLRLAAFGGIWFFLALSVESSFIALADVIFEHRLYLPAAGASISISTAVFMAGWAERPGRLRAFTIAAMALVVVAFSASAIQRNSVWGSEAGLWEDTLKKSPSKPRVLVNLAAAYVEEGRNKEAADAASMVLRLRPGDPAALVNLGAASLAAGKPDEALEPLAAAIAGDPELAEAYNMLGVALMRKGDYEESHKAFLAAIRLDPARPGIYTNMAALFGEAGDYEKALAASSRAISLNPYDWTAYNNAGLAYASEGRHQEAAAMFVKSIELNPYYPEARYNFALSLLYAGKAAEAEAEYDALQRLDPSLAGRLIEEIGARPEGGGQRR